MNLYSFLNNHYFSVEQNGTIEPTVQANPCQLNDCDIIETHFEQQTQTNKSNTGSTQQSWETNRKL